MREIKFRAWDTADKIMSYGEVEYFDDMLGFRFRHFEACNPDEIIYEQYTGLKDKNGREIYEGDIVHVWSRLGRGWRDRGIHVVRYADGLAQFLPDDICHIEATEVLGNIHENGILLAGE